MSRKKVALLPVAVAIFIVAAASIAALVVDSKERRELRLEGKKVELEHRLRKLLELNSAAARRSLQALMRSRWGDELMLAVEKGEVDGPLVRDFCPNWIKLMGLDAMMLVDATGSILSSGHLPAEVGNQADWQEVSADGDEPVFKEITLRRKGRLERALAWMVSATRRWQGRKVVLWGGKLLGNSVCEWQELLGAGLKLEDGSGRQVESNCSKDGYDAVGEDVVVSGLLSPSGKAFRYTANYHAGEAGIEGVALLVEAIGLAMAFVVLLLGKKFL
ncbi:MAG: hypothetical protein D6806_09565 [Deltaproteobacteria bacterium]|nr:MAG: hypothetical protein D6806_09565 [Deltaproteobacteria bacterium]